MSNTAGRESGQRMPLKEAFGLGIGHLQGGRPAAAENVFRQILQAAGDHVSSLHYLGMSAFEQGRTDEGISLVRQSVKLKPEEAGYVKNLAMILRRAGRIEEAADALRQAAVLESDSAEVHALLGNALAEAGRYDEAAAALSRALEIDPRLAGACNNLGNACMEEQRYDQGEAAFRRALEIEPDYLDALNGLGVALTSQGRLEDALPPLDRALAMRADFAAAHYSRGEALLLAGRFEEGWAEYEWRWASNHLPTPAEQFDCPQWSGENLAGRRILLMGEQGLGDMIQAARFVPLVTGRGGRVLLECPKPLERLFASLAGVGEIIPRGSPMPAFDAHCPTMSLPMVFAATSETIPADVPYLYADPADARAWRERLAGRPGMRVGVVWASKWGTKSSRLRSMPVEMLAPLLEVKGCEFYSLQVGERAGDLACLSAGLVTDLSPHLSDFADTAAAIEALDLVISVDTAVPHLAGALGKPVWVMVPYAPAWRWMVDRSDSPWYPTMRLYRQARPRDWAGLVERVRADLTRELELSSPGADGNRR